MADVNLQLVREFFELNLFHVLTHWQHDPAYHRLGDHSVQLFVENTNPIAGFEPGFVLTGADLVGIHRAVVEVRAWHADRFYPSVIESSAVLSQFVQEEALALPREIFRDQEFTTILVISELPNTSEQRARSIRLLQGLGIGHVLEFPTILSDLLDKLSINANYQASQTLQTLRLLKRYRLIRNQQLEFPFPADPPVVFQATIASDVPSPQNLSLFEEEEEEVP